jgi:3'(2'), 5'-bisphosphate nucleotidase
MRRSDLVIPAVVEAGKLVLREQAALSHLHSTNEDGSVVMEADLASQRILARACFKACPDIPILVEEQDAAAMDDLRRQNPGINLVLAPDDLTMLPDPCWSIDPIDGGASLKNGGREWVVNVALLEGRKPTVNIVYAPAYDHGVLLVAEKGDGCCHVNGVPTHVSRERTIANAQVGLDDCHLVKKRDAQFRTNVIDRIKDDPRVIYVQNNPSSVSIALHLVAWGEIVAFVSGHLKNWDVAAPLGIALEAGAIVEAIDGSPITFETVRMKPLMVAVNDEAANLVRDLTRDSRVTAVL